MRLEVSSINVRDIQFSKQTRLEDGILHVNANELRGLLMEGDHFSDVIFGVARPGDKTRIIHSRRGGAPM
jgi:sarcosine reductase